VSVKRPQAILAVLSLLLGAAVISMLLNLYGGVQRKMTQEFRAYGANVVLAPGPSASITHPNALLPSQSESVKKNGEPCHPDPATAGEGSQQFVGSAGEGKNNCRDSSPAKSGGLRMTGSSLFSSATPEGNQAPLSPSPTGEGNQESSLPSTAGQTHSGSLLPSPPGEGQGWGSPASTTGASVMDQSVMNLVEEFARQRRGVLAVPLLYAVVRLKRSDPRLPEFENVVAVGTDLAGITQMNPGWRENSVMANSSAYPPSLCYVGSHIASRLHVNPGDTIYLEPLASSTAWPAGAGANCQVASVLATGSSEDDEVFVALEELQRMMGMPGKISFVQLRLEGGTAEIESSIRELSKALPGIEVRPIRQILYSEGRVLGVIRWFLLSVTVLILVTIVICLTATMTAIVLERRKDIGLMKALGASDRQVMRLFLAEGAALGMVGGCIGFFLGSSWAFGLAHHLFGVVLNVTWWTLPLVCGLALILAVGASVFSVRIVRAIQPAVVLKGE